MITVRVPATSANLGSGFDVFGAALDRPCDIVRVERADQTTIDVTGIGSQHIPTDPEKNTAGVVAEALDATVSISIDKGIRPSSGLGSSAASAAGVAVAINELYDLGLTKRDLIPYAAEGEAVVAGAPHIDNVAPAILGGFTIATPELVSQVDTRIPLVACLPDIVVSTEDARSILPSSAPIDDIVDTIGRASTLTVGMLRNDPVLVGQGMEDRIVTPKRAALIDGYKEVRRAALTAGATGVTVSGSGPTMLAACHRSDRRRIAAAMVEAFDAVDISARAYATAVGSGPELYR